ncbi:MAG: MarR family winged helix-turn-helix transcriptional regulator [Chloroflexota bacterium]|jgi:DNA-binding MarR family transcriptional regulator
MSWPHDKQKQETWTRFWLSLNPEIDPRAISLMDDIRLVARAIYHVAEQSLDEATLSFAQFKVLMHLFFAEQMGDRSDLNPSEISIRHGVSRNTMSSLISTLEEMGLLERRLDPDDRRRFKISLTEKGRSLVIEYARHHLTMVGSCFSALTDDEQETLSRLLRKVRTQAETVRPTI